MKSLITVFETEVADKICYYVQFFVAVSGNQQDLSSVKSEDFGNVQEMSTKSLIVGPLSLRLDSSAVHRIMKMIVCALEHEYEPYSKTKPGLLLLHIHKYTELNQTTFSAFESAAFK